jgi:phospholipase/carboxylesterase
MAAVDALKGPSRAPASGKTATAAVVLLHGYGASGDDLIGLAPYFAQALPDAVFYSPNAPEAWEGGMGAGRQWFGLGGYDPDMMRRDPSTMNERFRVMIAGAEKPAAVLNIYLDQILAEHKLDANRLALLGFSQGTMMSLHVGLRREKQLGAILGFSGALTGADRLPAEIKSKPPVTLVHGDADPVVPVQAMGEIEKTLKSLGVPVDTHVIPGLQHGIDGSGAQIGATFLKKYVG